MPCQHFALVVGEKQTFVPDSGLAGMRGERIVFPQVPSGVRITFLARNPANTLEELWMLCKDDNIVTELGAFFTLPNVRQLSYQEMVETGKKFDPGFVAPPVAL